VPNIYQHIDSNKRETVVVMVLFIAIVTFVGWFVGEYFGEEGLGLPVAGIAVLFSGISSFVSFYASDKMVLAISQAREVTVEENHDLHNLVENMSIASGIPKPKIYMIEDSAMNAFATGRDPNHSVICFTRGIVYGLEKRELEGVIAHEMSHIGNRDTLLMTIVCVLVGTLALLSDWFTRGIFYGGRRNSRRGSSNIAGPIFLIGLVLLILSPLIATLIKMAISRNREFLADSTAALITRYPKGLADALAKLAVDREILEVANSATAHLYIDDPVVNRAGGFFASLFNTHPPIEERIQRLLSM
jgi:heat shock protein HtpX